MIIRMRTSDRAAGARLPSLTSIWRSAELQEREIFDLYGIRFDGHPDLRRILMWDEFVDHPMRKDYVEPDDYEYEPTPHDEVLAQRERALHAATQPRWRREYYSHGFTRMNGANGMKQKVKRQGSGERVGRSEFQTRIKSFVLSV